MNKRSFDELEQVFHQAQVELPPHLEARLTAIPQVSTQVKFWDIRWILPTIALAPIFIWWLTTRASTWLSTIASKFISLVAAISPPSLTEVAPLLIGLTGGILVAAILSTWFYLRGESQETQTYVQHLTAAR